MNVIVISLPVDFKIEIMKEKVRLKRGREGGYRSARRSTHRVHFSERSTISNSRVIMRRDLNI